MKIYLKLMVIYTMWLRVLALEHLPLQNENPSLKQLNIVQWITSIFLPRPPQINATTDYEIPANNCPTCWCGLAYGNERIVGGYEAQENKYPWIVLLKYKGLAYCAGSLISDLYVLTSGKCVRGFSKKHIRVVLLAHRRENEEELARQVADVLIHPEYSSYTYDNDISLIKLSEGVEFSDRLSPVCFPEENLEYAGKQALVLGWGMTDEESVLANKLQEVQVPIWTQDKCRSSKYGWLRITDNMMCAGFEEGGKDACQGDSGGPLLVYEVNSYTFHLAGIVSWGEGCARPELPGVYTRVSRYLAWIAENTGDSCQCGVPKMKTEGNKS